MDDYQEALAWLHSFPRVAPSPGLQRMRRLCAAIGDPQKKLAGRFLHVAGTNGKGSVCAFCAAALQRAGLRTGLYISPFIHDFRERIVLDGVPVSREVLLRHFAKIRAAADRLLAQTGETPAEFELTTLLGFSVFAEYGCDAVVLETGLGGRLDATNVCDPALTVIMHIALDHTELLGDTVEKIAAEKAGILKEGRPVVLYPQQTDGVLQVLNDAAARSNSPVLVPQTKELRILSESCDGTRFVWNGTPFSIALAGAHQVQNALCAITALRRLAEDGFPVRECDIQSGLAAATFPARLETLCRAPRVLLDGAHNADGIAALRRATDRLFAGQQLIGICGMLCDKAPADALAPFLQDSPFKTVFCVAPASPRAMTADALAKVFSAHGIHAVACADAAEACRAALACADKKTPVLAFGSLYLANDVTRAVKALS